MPITDDRIHLVLVECGDSVDGSQRLVWELATGLSPRRFDTQVWLSPSPEMDAFAGALDELGVPVERLSRFDSARHGWSLLGSWLKIGRRRSTLLHMHCPRASLARVPALLAAAAGDSRVVLSIRPPGRSLARFDRALERRTVDRADVVTTWCAREADALVHGSGVSRGRVRVIPPGVDTPDEAQEIVAARQLRERFGASSTRPLWVCAGRLEAERGPSVLLQALELLREREVPFVAVIAGEGAMRSALERRVADSGMGAQVHFLGETEEAGAMLRAADVVVVPVLEDCFSRSLVEAAARGRPIVASAVASATSLLEEGHADGRLVPAGDAPALASALEAMQNRPDAAWRMGRMNAARVGDAFAWSRVVESFESIYDEALGLATFSPDEHGAMAAR